MAGGLSLEEAIEAIETVVNGEADCSCLNAVKAAFEAAQEACVVVRREALIL